MMGYRGPRCICCNKLLEGKERDLEIDTFHICAQCLEKTDENKPFNFMSKSIQVELISEYLGRDFDRWLLSEHYIRNIRKEK